MELKDKNYDLKYKLDEMMLKNKEIENTLKLTIEVNHIKI